MGKGRYYNTNPTPDNFRALWDSIHRLSADVTDAKATIAAQQATIAQQQTALTKAAQQAQQALLTAGQATTLAGTPVGGGGGTPVTHLTIPDHLPDVQAIWAAAQPTVHTLEWGFKRTQELAWQFRAEIVEGVPFAMGLLLSGGSNLYTCGGVTYKVGRVVYPDGHVFKLLTDIPTTMDPSWQDDGFVSPAQYHVATDPGVAC